MSGPQGEECAKRYFFEKKVYGGVCRLNPRGPGIHTLDGIEPGHLPLQKDSDWCGSWKQRPADGAAECAEQQKGTVTI